MDRHISGYTERRWVERGTDILDAHCATEHAARGSRTKTNKRAWLDNIQLRLEPRQAGAYLIRTRRLSGTPLAVRNPFEMFDGIGDIDVGLGNSGIGKRATQQTAGRTNERAAEFVLLVSGNLADQDDAGVTRAFTENRLRGMAIKIAAFTSGRGRAQRREIALVRQKIRRRTYATLGAMDDGTLVVCMAHLQITTRDHARGSCYDISMETTGCFTTSDSVDLHYRLWRGQGKRPLIVLLHGLSSNMTRWSEFVEHTNLKERFDILRLDLRGHGESFTRKPISLEIWSRDLAQLLASLRYERVVVIGHSLGANVALWFAAMHPEHIIGVGLIDPTLTEALRGQALGLRRTSWLIRATVFVLRCFNRLGFRRRHIPTRDLRALDEDVRVRLLGAGKAEDFVKRYTSPMADLKYFPTAHYLQEVVEITRPIPHLERVRVPLLALISKAVTFTDTEKTRAALARCPQPQIVMLSAYHWPLTEQPVEVRQAIEKWALPLA